MMVLAAVVAVLVMWLVAVRPSPETKSDEPEPTASAAMPPQPTAAPAQPQLAAAPEPQPEPDPEPQPQPQPEPAAAAPAPGAKPFWSDMIKGDQGPVAEYRKRYETEARDDDAMKYETHVRSAFEKAKAHGLLQSVSCHRTICKLVLSWSDARTYDYIKSVTWMGLGGPRNPGQLGFDLPLALSPSGEKGADGARPVELFVLRR